MTEHNHKYEQTLKHLQQLAKSHPERAIQCSNVFCNPTIDITPLREQFYKESPSNFIAANNIPEFKDLPSLPVSITDLFPTQHLLHITNLEATKEIGNETGAYLIYSGGKYHIFDGHHRIANRILQGHYTVSAFIFNGQ